MKRVLILLVFFLVVGCASMDLSQREAAYGPNPPSLKEGFSLNGQTPYIYLLADDPDGDMHRIIAYVTQEGGISFEDSVPVSGRDSKNLSGFISFPGGIACFRPNTPISVTLYVEDKAGHRSKGDTFQIEVAIANSDTKVPSQFKMENLGIIYDRACPIDGANKVGGGNGRF